MKKIMPVIYAVVDEAPMIIAIQLLEMIEIYSR